MPAEDVRRRGGRAMVRGSGSRHRRPGRDRAAGPGASRHRRGTVRCGLGRAVVRPPRRRWPGWLIGARRPRDADRHAMDPSSDAAHAARRRSDRSLGATLARRDRSSADRVWPWPSSRSRPRSSRGLVPATLGRITRPVGRSASVWSFALSPAAPCSWRGTEPARRAIARDRCESATPAARRAARARRAAGRRRRRRRRPIPRTAGRSPSSSSGRSVSRSSTSCRRSTASASRAAGRPARAMAGRRPSDRSTGRRATPTRPPLARPAPTSTSSSGSTRRSSIDRPTLHAVADLRRHRADQIPAWIASLPPPAEPDRAAGRRLATASRPLPPTATRRDSRTRELVGEPGLEPGTSGI